MMQKSTLYGLAAVFLSSLSGCAVTVKQIGDINMISQRNVDSRGEYVLVKTYAGGGKEIKKSRARNVQEAVDQTVRNAPGGEFLKNAKIYLIDGKYLAVEGDVWGQGQGNFKGFRVGDKVQWKTITGNHNGVIKGFLNDQRCMVQEDGKTSSAEQEYDKLRKVGE